MKINPAPQTPRQRAQAAMRRLDRWISENNGRGVVAYHCFEYGIRGQGNTRLPIASGGLGWLAGDTVREAADMGLPLVANGILWRDGYFQQSFDLNGRQQSSPDSWDPSKHPGLADLGLALESEKIPTVNIGGNKVTLRPWMYAVEGKNGFVPLLLLDSAGYPNMERAEAITRQLYGGGNLLRLQQEMVFGIGGVRLLSALGVQARIDHLNEGHGAFVGPERLRERRNDFREITPDDIARQKAGTRFTTHTRVPAGFDRFPVSFIEEMFAGEPFLRDAVRSLGRDPSNPGEVNMAVLATGLAGEINGVSRLHARVSEHLFPGRTIIPITNGVHVNTWAADPLAAVYDKYVSGWRQAPSQLGRLMELKDDPEFREALWTAHQQAKRQLLKQVNRVSGRKGKEVLHPDVPTICFARRFATYKRGDLPLREKSRLIDLARENGGLQIIYAGRAHPADDPAKSVLREALRLGQELEEESRGMIKFVFVSGYDGDLAAKMAAGGDVWVNVPVRPEEASGTSGMKAAANAVPHLSTEDGWWVERRGGGWTINEGRDLEPTHDDPLVYRRDTEGYFVQLAEFLRAYQDRSIIGKMVEAAGLNAPYFSTRRMLEEYQAKMWQPDGTEIGHRGVAPVVQTTPLHTGLLRISDAAFNIAQAGSRPALQEIIAAAIFECLPGARHIIQYEVHNTAVRMGASWKREREGGLAFREEGDQIPVSHFQDWRMFADFGEEVMADVLRSGAVQVVLDPAADPRCYRGGRLVSAVPFMLAPKIVRGEIQAVWKIKIATEGEIGRRHEPEFVSKLLGIAGSRMEQLLQQELEADLAGFSDARALLNWSLTLMTGGGFAAMPRYAVEGNRAAIFLSRPDGNFSGSMGVGQTSAASHYRVLDSLGQDVFRNGVEQHLRSVDQSASEVSRLISDTNLGNFEMVSGSILFTPTGIQYAKSDFSGSFDGQRLADLTHQLRGLFEVDGNQASSYLLMPIKGEDGGVIGLVYLDNPFDPQRLLSPNKYQLIVDGLGRNLARLTNKSA